MNEQRELPAVIAPTGTRCITVTIPDDDEWERQFFSEASRLAIWTWWKRDGTHNATNVAKAWRQALSTWGHCKPIEPVTGIGGAGGEDENLIRQNPDNPCELQTSIDGTHWCTFADFSKCIPQIGQPGDGSQQPGPGGGQECYNGQLQANSVYLVPTVVSTGDVLNLQSISGAGNDGSVSPWHCPDGDTFFAGACVGGSGGLSGTDPLNTVNHMRILYKINGVYYDAMAGAFTVPGGVTNQQVLLQVNDSNIADNAGSYQFKLCVTNNIAPSWVQDFDFLVTNGGFVISSGQAQWFAGLGWSGNPTNTPQACYIYFNLKSSAFTLTRMNCTTITSAPPQGYSGLLYNLYGTPGVLASVNAPYASTPGGTYDWTGSQSGAAATTIGFSLNVDNAYTDEVIRHAHFEGLGVNPFI